MEVAAFGEVAVRSVAAPKRRRCGACAACARPASKKKCVGVLAGSVELPDEAADRRETQFSPREAAAARGWMDWAKIAAVDGVLRALPVAEEQRVLQWFQRQLCDGAFTLQELRDFCEGAVALAMLPR